MDNRYKVVHSWYDIGITNTHMEKGTTSTKAPTDSILEKQGNLEKPPKKNNGHGGARAGSGKKKDTEREVKRTLTEIAEQHANEVVEMRIIDKATNTVRIEKKTRSEWLLETLYNEGVNRKVIPAIKEYFDRTRGKPRQELELSGEIKTDTQRTPNMAEVAAAQAYESNL